MIVFLILSLSSPKAPSSSEGECGDDGHASDGDEVLQTMRDLDLLSALGHSLNATIDPERLDLFVAATTIAENVLDELADPLGTAATSSACPAADDVPTTIAEKTSGQATSSSCPAPTPALELQAAPPTASTRTTVDTLREANDKIYGIDGEQVGRWLQWGGDMDIASTGVLCTKHTSKGKVCQRSMSAPLQEIYNRNNLECPTAAKNNSEQLSLRSPSLRQRRCKPVRVVGGRAQPGFPGRTYVPPTSCTFKKVRWRCGGTQQHLFENLHAAYTMVTLSDEKRSFPRNLRLRNLRRPVLMGYLWAVLCVDFMIALRVTLPGCAV